MDLTEFDPPVTTWMVAKITEDEHQVEVLLQRTTWEHETEESYEQAMPGQPGATFSRQRGVQMPLVLAREHAMRFDVGRHYTLALTEIIDVDPDAEDHA